MDEARAVLERLGRIDALERDGAPAGELLDELRELVREAEAWARREGPGAQDALDAIDRAQAALEEVHQLI
jgi:broad specificity phosphatase PhoE